MPAGTSFSWQGPFSTPGHRSRSQLILQASLFHVRPVRFGFERPQPALSQRKWCQVIPF